MGCRRWNTRRTQRTSPNGRVSCIKLDEFRFARILGRNYSFRRRMTWRAANGIEPGRYVQDFQGIGLSSYDCALDAVSRRSEEHTSELQSLMRISYAVFCLKKKMKTNSCEQNN